MHYLESFVKSSGDSLIDSDISLMGNGRPWWAKTTEKRSISHSWTWKSTAVVAVVFIVVSAGLGAVIKGIEPPKVTEWGFGQQYRASIDALAAGCGPVTTINNAAYIEKRVGTVPGEDEDGNPIALRYVTTVPFLGPMFEEGVDTDSQTIWTLESPRPPQLESVLRSLYDGWMVAYYNQKADPKIGEALQSYAIANPDLKMLVVPWPTDRAAIPQRKNVAYAVWGATQQCTDMLSYQIQEFRAQFPPESAPGYNGDTPRELSPDQVQKEILRKPTPSPSGSATPGEQKQTPGPADSSPSSTPTAS